MSFFSEGFLQFLVAEKFPFKNQKNLELFPSAFSR